MNTRLVVFLISYLVLGPVYADGPGPNRPDAATMGHACAGCHGSFGRSLGATPPIAGMPEAEFIRLMREFKSGQRVSSIMNRIARGYTDEDFIGLARFFRHH